MIREAAPADFGPVRSLLLDAFPGPEEAALVERLRTDGDAAIELVFDDGAISGHILFSPMKAPFPALALAPVAVAPARQRQGSGSALVRAGLDRARAGGWRAAFVLGDPAYYRRLGFEATLAAHFASPYGGPAFQAIALAPLPEGGGTVRHAPAFAALG